MQQAQCLMQQAVSDAASTVPNAASTVSDAASTVSNAANTVSNAASTVSNAAITVLSVCFERRDNQLADNEIVIGFAMKQLLHIIRDEVEHGKFYSGVRPFFSVSASYLTTKCNCNDPVLHHAQFVDFKKLKKTSNFRQ